jgi:type IV secretory pathway VirB4 component
MQPEAQNQYPQVQPGPSPAPQVPLNVPQGPTANQPQNTPMVGPKRNPNTTQNTLLISEIRDNLVVMNDGSFRAVVACKSINFDLMSEREREAVEYSYQNFLNSLYFPIQIFIRSQRVDIGPYIERLDKIRHSQDNMLLGVLMEDYINFIGVLSEETNIMDKQFYIVVPFYTTPDINNALSSSKTLFSGLFMPQQQQHIKIDEATYNKAKDEIRNRTNTVINGLFQLGVKSVQLNTKQLGELYYNVYNPDTAVREPLGDFENVTSATVIRKGQGQAAQPHMNQETM